MITPEREQRYLPLPNFASAPPSWTHHEAPRPEADRDAPHYRETDLVVRYQVAAARDAIQPGNLLQDFRDRERLEKVAEGEAHRALGRESPLGLASPSGPCASDPLRSILNAHPGPMRFLLLLAMPWHGRSPQARKPLI
jgi:hypothetical protein